MDFPTYSSAIAILLCTMTSATLAQSGRLSRPRPVYELGVAAPAVIVEDANGAKLESGFAPVIGASAAWSLNARVSSFVGLRASTASLSGSDDSSDWDAGRTSQVGIHIGVEHALVDRFAVSVTAGPTWFLGPDDVTPFRDAPSPMHWGGSVGARWRVMQSRPVSATLALDGFMIGGTSAADPIVDPAWVRRIIIGVRHGL